MSIKKLNQLDKADLKVQLTRCCGSENWVNILLNNHPFNDEKQLFELAEKVWKQDCEEADWHEAFTHHPKIGDIDSLAKKFANTQKWASNEQAGVNAASMETLQALAKGNQDYEQKFGYIFIVCATGKTADEMLHLLQKRLDNDTKTELQIAKAEQHKITVLRLQKLLNTLENS